MITLDFTNEIYNNIPITRQIVLEKLGSKPLDEVNSVILNATTTEIGDYAFKDCINLFGFSNKDNIVKVGNYAFSGCTRFRSGLKSLKYIGDYSFEGTGFLTLQSSTIEQLGQYCFKNCTLLTDVELLNVTNIEAGAFFGCTQLKNFKASPTTTEIGDYAFKDCINLFGFSNKDNIVKVGNYAFSGCTRFRSGFKSLKYIGDYSFEKTNFEAVTFQSCTEIGRYAFLSCENLSSLTARKCTFVDYNAFYGTKLWDIEPSEV